MSSFTESEFDPLDLFEDESCLDSFLFYEDCNDKEFHIEEYQPLGKYLLMLGIHMLMSIFVYFYVDTFQQFCSDLKYDPFHPEGLVLSSYNLFTLLSF
jgi:hypothetical protein